LIKSTDDGLTWNKLNVNLSTNKIVASPTGFLLCFSNDYVHVSYDEGTTWKSTGMLKGVNAAIAGSSGTIYAGTIDQGVVVSSDTGATWKQSNNGLNNVYVSSLAVASNGTLLCGTVSVGVFRSLETVVTVPKVASQELKDFMLLQNYPNPFNPVTTITFNIPYACNVSLKLYDAVGREVAELVNGKKNIGAHSVQFNAPSLASGIYFYRIIAGDYLKTMKLILMK
jgi:hypothetical protein